MTDYSDLRAKAEAASKVFLGAVPVFGDDLAAILAELEAGKARIAELEAGQDWPRLAKRQPCGCVVCTCQSDVQCGGCGAKRCGKADCVLEGDRSKAVWESHPLADRAERAEAELSEARAALEKLLSAETVTVQVGYDQGGNYMYAEAVRTDSEEFARARFIAKAEESSKKPTTTKSCFGCVHAAAGFVCDAYGCEGPEWPMFKAKESAQ